MGADSRQNARKSLALGSRRDVAWLAAISATLLLTLLPFSSYIASIPFIRAEWGMSNTQAAVVFGAYLAGYAASSALLLPATDRLPAGRVLLGSVALIAVSNLLFPLAWDVWSAIPLRFAAGAGHVGAYIPGIRLVSLRFAGGNRGAAVAIFVAAGYAGTTLSYVFMGQMLAAFDGWRIAYLITSLVALIGVALAAVAIRGAREETPPPPSAPPGGLVMNVLRYRPTLLVNIAYALHTAELYLARLWLPLLLAAALESRGADAADSAALAATWSGFMFMTGIAGVFAGGAVSDRIGRTAAAALVFAASGAMSFAVGWLVGAPAWVVIALGFAYGFATAADSAIYSTAVTELAPRGMIGSTQAAQSVVGFSVGAVAPIAAGGLLDAFRGATGWGAAFGFNGALAVVGVGALLLLRRLPEAERMAAGRK